MLLLLGAGLAAPAAAQNGADLNISPKRIVFDPGDRSETVYVFNQGDRTATYAIDLIDRIMLADGQIVPASERPDIPVASARSVVQYAPRRVTLAPGESQAVRVRARPVEGGERRSHLTVTTVPPETDGLTVEQAQSDAADVSFRLRALFSISIPVIVRSGPADARAAIQGAALIRDGGQVVLSLDLVRLGAGSVYGDVEAFVGAGRDRRLVGAMRGVAVYPEVQRRAVSMTLGDVAPGQTVTVRYRDDDAGAGAVLASVQVSSP